MQIRCNLEKYKGCSMSKDGESVQIKSFVVRETDGKDEANAALKAQAKGGAASATEECIRLSLVEVNEEPVNVGGKPYEAFDDWNSRARGFAIAAWRRLNVVTDKEADAFLDEAEVDAG